MKQKYFQWMCTIVSGTYDLKQKSYQKLLRFLDRVDFFYTIDLDGNRESDGIDLRYRFGSEEGYDDSEVSLYLDHRPCSVLEMMVALSIRCEEHIMDNPDVGDRTGQWFWGMIENLGLLEMTDEKFDNKIARDVIDRFLNRKYQKNGEGGLFTVHHRREDLRKVEIWYQMCWYLSEFMGL